MVLSNLGIVTVLLVLGLVQLSWTCSIEQCTRSMSPLLPSSCTEYTNYLQCLKKEHDSCTDQMGRMGIIAGMYYMANPFCGYDQKQLQAMLSLQMSVWQKMLNGSMGNWMFFGDDGPFDDGPFDDGPFDDGPFDDGPFDDGPFGDDGNFMGMGMGSAILNQMTGGNKPEQTQATAPITANTGSRSTIQRASVFGRNTNPRTASHKKDTQDSGVSTVRGHGVFVAIATVLSILKLRL